MEMTNELTSRIEALEKRVETLEAALKDYQQNVGDGKKNTPQVIKLTWLRGESYVELSDGKILKRYWIGDTLREVKAFANLIGYEYDQKVKKDKLVGELINKYGSNGWVLSNGQLMSSTGEVSRVNPCGINDVLTQLRGPYWKGYDIPETFNFAPNATDAEKLDVIINAVKNAPKK